MPQGYYTGQLDFLIVLSRFFWLKPLSIQYISPTASVHLSVRNSIPAKTSSQGKPTYIFFSLVAGDDAIDPGMPFPQEGYVH